MRDKPSLNRKITSEQGLLIRSLLKFYFVLLVATLFFLNEHFYYLVMRKCISTTVRVNGTVQFTSFLAIRLNISIVTSCDSLIAILIT